MSVLYRAFIKSLLIYYCANYESSACRFSLGVFSFSLIRKFFFGFEVVLLLDFFLGGNLL
jgi:hypothetical protein